MTCKRILVVEDDVDIRRQVVDALKMEGHMMLEAGNGQEALDLLLGLPPGQIPSCIVLDIMMPVMDGIAFMEIIESNYKERFGSIHVIVATAKNDPKSFSSTSKSMVRIQKPFDLEDLYRAVEKC